MPNKRFLTMSALILLFFVLAACSVESRRINANPSPSDAPEKGIALSFRTTWKAYSGRGEAIQAIVDQYNPKYKDSMVTLTDGDEDRAAVEALLKSGNDTVYVLPYRFVKYFGNKGSLLDLSTVFQDKKELFYPEVWALGTADGKTYGIPWLGHSMCLLYNKSLLKAAGVDASSIDSIQTLIKAMELIETKTDAKGIGLVGANCNDVSWMVNQFIYGFGSSLVSEDGKKVAINNEKSKAALEMYRDVLAKYAQPTWTNDTGVEVMTCFRNQEIAFEIQGIWGVTDILKNGSPFEVGIIPLKKIGLCSEVGPMMLAIPSGIREESKQEAIRFIDYMISKKAQEEIMKGEYSPEHEVYYPFRTPIRLDMADSPIFQTHPEYKLFLEGFENPSIDVPVPAWEIVKDEIYGDGLHRVMCGEMTIEAFLDRVESQGNQILIEQ